MNLRTLFLCVPALVATQAYAGTFNVTKVTDAGPGSLRQALLDANGNVGADRIEFHIAGSGVHTIAPASDLPTITDPVTIDGYSQSGATPNTLATGNNAVLKIELSGAHLPG